MLIYQEDKKANRVLIAETNSMEGAAACIKEVARIWKGSKKGRSFTHMGVDGVARYSDGKAAFIIYADTVPYPAAEPDAQPRRTSEVSK
jgi:hypothetical protein